MTTPDLNLPYFPPEDTSTRSLTDQLFKQQAIITDLLEALKIAYDGLLLAESICGTEAWRFVKSRQQAHQAICLAADQS